ncbi:MAG TPA: AraC family transcriptional regulator [Clostridia bacterium]|nr:AraC family transcriptional regulator [Clostridia bacterium]
MSENNYVLTINQAINFIHDNIDKNLTVEDIASHCCFSKYYFNRIFRSIVNESIYSFTKRMKLENAAFKLRTNRKKAVTEIALEAGYSPSNFATAFKEYFGMSASDFRENCSVPVKDSYIAIAEHVSKLKKQEDFYRQIDSRITVKHLPGMLLEYERFIGNYYDMEVAWERFCSEMSRNHRIKEDTRFIGISYDDPLISDENKCMYDMCITIDVIKSISVHRIEGGLYACYDFYDRLENLGKAFNEIFSLWLPYSGHTIDNRPPLEIYQTPLDEEWKMQIDICIPII